MRPIVGDHGAPVATVGQPVFGRDRLDDAVDQQRSATAVVADAHLGVESQQGRTYKRWRPPRSERPKKKKPQISSGQGKKPKRMFGMAKIISMTHQADEQQDEADGR